MHDYSALQHCNWLAAQMTHHLNLLTRKDENFGIGRSPELRKSVLFRRITSTRSALQRPSKHRVQTEDGTRVKSKMKHHVIAAVFRSPQAIHIRPEPDITNSLFSMGTANPGHRHLTDNFNSGRIERGRATPLFWKFAD